MDVDAASGTMTADASAADLAPQMCSPPPAAYLANTATGDVACAAAALASVLPPGTNAAEPQATGLQLQCPAAAADTPQQLTLPPGAAAALAAASTAAASAGAVGPASNRNDAPAASGAATADAMAGFELQSNGSYYNSVLGYWFDPQRQLFGDAGTGLWYRYTAEGRYEQVA